MKPSSTEHRPARCLITGATGFIGTRLCERLAAQGAQPLVAMVRRPDAAAGLQALGATTRQGDLLDRNQVERALEGCDAVVHLAHGDKGPQATRQLVQRAVAAGVRRFVHVSTMSVHGPRPGPEAAREDTARIGRYNQDYCDSKAEQEEIVQAAIDRGDLPAVILRPTVVYGPHSHFVTQVIQQARGGVVDWFDEGAGLCNAVYVDDVCDAIDAALVSPAALGQAMFVNADTAVTWREFITAFAGMVQPPPRFENLSSAQAIAYWEAHPPAQARGLLDRVRLKLMRMAGSAPAPAPWPALGRVERETFRIHYSNDKARRLLGWAPAVDFAHGVELTRTWLAGAGMRG